MTALSWLTQAACGGMDQAPWFPTQGNGAGWPWGEARAICVCCPVRIDCLVYALEFERGLSENARKGMFGGLTPHERHRIRHNNPKETRAHP